MSRRLDRYLHALELDPTAPAETLNTRVFESVAVEQDALRQQHQTAVERIQQVIESMEYGHVVRQASEEEVEAGIHLFIQPYGHGAEIPVTVHTSYGALNAVKKRGGPVIYVNGGTDEEEDATLSRYLEGQIVNRL